ncbi:F-box domain containing protein [Tanacetum coccineum]|uniref:F-box domain containing protein n=1 Tax=Tanacetum coccineum TaxID=301880 RepID=A0ABQ5GF87_9ASTR
MSEKAWRLEDGQSTVVDAPPNIIDVPDEDDDIIGDEDALPHDLADSDAEDLINVDDDGVEKMSADVALVPRTVDGGRDDRPHPHVARSVPLYYPSWEKVPKERKAVIISEIGADPTTGSYDLEAIRRARPEEITTDEWDKYIKFWNDPKNLARAAQNRLNRQKSVVTYRQGSRSLARLRDEMEEKKRLEVGEYTEDVVNALARGGKLHGHISDVGRVLPSRATSKPKATPSIGLCLEFESGGASGSGGRDDDEEGGNDEDGDGMISLFFFRKKSGKTVFPSDMSAGEET